MGRSDASEAARGHSERLSSEFHKVQSVQLSRVKEENVDSYWSLKSTAADHTDPLCGNLWLSPVKARLLQDAPAALSTQRQR